MRWSGIWQKLIKVVGFFAALVEFGEEFGDGGRPETAENFVIFFGADALVDDVGGGAGGGDAVAHEMIRDESKS